MDGGSVHKVIDLIPASVEAKNDARDDAAIKEAETYLDGQFPNWRDPSAYWD
jgi:flavin-binding protein dodecin